MKRTTTDGIHWSKAQNVLVSDARTDRILSPAIIYENGRYKMWTVNCKENSLFYTVKVKMVFIGQLQARFS